MRIISQDGLIDVPYEQISIEIRENEIWVGYTATLEKMCVAKRFAKYSTPEKAEKSMQMLLDNYAYNWKLEHGLQTYYGDEPIVFRFPREDEL